MIDEGEYYLKFVVKLSGRFLRGDFVSFTEDLYKVFRTIFPSNQG